MNRISIITICFNNLEELQKTCISIDAQTIVPFEHLIMDGSSNTIIKNFLHQNPQPSYRRSVHEQDNGISDAFNKGIKESKGNILVLLNSGDQFYSKDSLIKVVKVFEEHPQINWLHAKYKLFRGRQWVIIGKPHHPEKVYRGMRSICHQTMFVRKELYNRFGLYDTKLKIGMDYDFLLRIKDEPFYFIKEPIVSYAPAGISSLQYLDSLKETSMIFRSRFGNTFLHQVWQLRLKSLYYLLHSPVGKMLYKIKVWLRLENF
jgi:glycosyltransferase involved in cell wall biosynthesis